MKKLFFLLIVLFLVGCEPNIQDLKPPIILVAKSSEGDILLRDKDSTYLSFNSNYYVAKSISNTYEVGDTLK